MLLQRRFIPRGFSNSAHGLIEVYESDSSSLNMSGRFSNIEWVEAVVERRLSVEA